MFASCLLFVVYCLWSFVFLSFCGGININILRCTVPNKIKIKTNVSFLFFIKSMIVIIISSFMMIIIIIVIKRIDLCVFCLLFFFFFFAFFFCLVLYIEDIYKTLFSNCLFCFVLFCFCLFSLSLVCLWY